jgi:hypothetical protein
MRDEISLQLFIGNLESEKGFLYDAQKQCVSATICCDDGKWRWWWTGDRASKLFFSGETMLQLVDKAAGASIIATTNMMMTARGPCFIRYSY